MPLKPKPDAAAIDKYFQDCDAGLRPYTVSGLATALGLTRLELVNRPLRGPAGRNLAIAIGRCETFAEERLLDGKNLTGVMFSLKNNFGWLEKVNPGESALEIIVSQPKPEEKSGGSDNLDPAGRISEMAGGNAEALARTAFGPGGGSSASRKN